jgi:CheY-like chemotaxis protein
MVQYTGLENKRILVVEDVELNQFLARHIMESWGCVVQIVENGALAVERINEDDFDIVLMDIQMPVMDGIQATRQIRGLEDINKSSIPIVALTANAMRGDFEMYIEAGMNDCLPKPFEEPDLFKTVSRNIRKNNTHSMQETIVSAPVVAVPFEKMYDLSMVESISGGDQSFIVKMLQLFLNTVPASLSEMRSFSDKGAWLELSKVAHKLKSTIDSMGIAELKQTIRDIENLGKAGKDTATIPPMVKTVIETMDRVMARVKKDYSL